MTVGKKSKLYDKEHMAKVTGSSLPISTKKSIEVCNFIRFKDLNKAKDFLNKVISLEAAVPFKRFNADTGHKTGIGPGRYPVKTSEEIVKLLESVEANAQFKGLDTSKLIIKHICANQASKSWHYGRQRKRKMKRTNIDIIVEERKSNGKKKAEGKKQVEKGKTESVKAVAEKTNNVSAKTEKPIEKKKMEKK